MREILKNTLFYRYIKYFKKGRRLLNSPIYVDGQEKSAFEIDKKVKRSEIINFLLKQLNRETYYLEIRVRDPNDNFIKVDSSHKYSVDPGVEYKQNPVDFKVSSDAFFHN